MRELVALHYSPWSEKARWALDHHGVPYRYTEYLPMLGEPGLRLRTRRLRGRVTVPVLLDAGGPYFDSWDIARRADSLGTGETLFPPERLDEIARWNERSEEALAVGRMLLTDRVARDPEARRAEVPPVVPEALRGVVTTPLTAQGLRFFRKKYGPVTPDESALEGALVALREALEAGGGAILGEPTYADYAMAVVLQMVEPVADEHIPLHPARRRCWTHPELAERFADLVEWRDALYARARRPAAA